MRERPIGRVAALHRYPVKSMRGERLAAAELRWTGIHGDRQYAFYRLTDRSRFPWLTGREVAEMVTYGAAYREPDDPRRSAVLVRVPSGEAYDLADAALQERLSRLAGEEVRLLQVGRGIFDSMPVSVVAGATAAQLAASAGGPVDLRRFRPNIIIETGPEMTATERDWPGATLAFGDGEEGARLRVNTPIERCAMITLDPDTGAKDPAMLRRVVQSFDNRIGAYCTSDRLGTIRLGDAVRLIG
jgi:uncharacterized protein YcbX